MTDPEKSESIVLIDDVSDADAMLELLSKRDSGHSHDWLSVDNLQVPGLEQIGKGTYPIKQVLEA